MFAKILALVPLLLMMIAGYNARAALEVATIVPIVCVCLVAAWSIVTAILPHLDPNGRAFAILSVVGSDLRQLADALTNWKPPSPPAATAAIMMLLLASCAFFRTTIEPLLGKAEQDFVTCVEAELPQVEVDLVTLNAAGEAAIAAKCLGKSIDDASTTANAPTVHAIAQSRLVGLRAGKAKATK
jgi:hypothetical protein